MVNVSIPCFVSGIIGSTINQPVMKNLLLVLGMIIFITSCSTTNKMADDTFRQALVGQNEMSIYARLGPPKRTIPAPGGGKIMVYEFYTKDMYLTPNKSKVTYHAGKDILGNSKGLTYTSGVNTVTNDPRYTIYQKSVSYLKVFLDKQGNCIRFEQDLPQEQLDFLHERFKHFSSKGQ